MQLERFGAHVVHHVAEDVNRASMDRLHGNALKDVGQSVVKTAHVALRVVQLDAVVGELTEVIVMNVDRSATARRERIDRVGEAANPVEANHMPLARDLDAPGILDSLGPGPGRGPLDPVVGDEVIKGRALGVASGGQSVFNAPNMTPPDDDPRRVMKHDAVTCVPNREILEPDVMAT